MPSDTATIIKEKLDIVEFIRSYVALTPAGKNWKGLCPFHREKTPSFMVSPDRQAWHCFGCNLGGDVISFLMRYENLDFVEALKVLADKAGVELRLTGTSDQKKYAALYEINRIAKDFFVSTIQEDQGKPSLKYLKDRGLKPETIKEFEIGLTGPNADALLRHLTKLGFSVSEIERAGLALKTERGTYWDRFRSRIMFPLHNHFGKVIGFTGRVLPGQESEKVGKYVNSPETPIFSKSKLLFGFFQTKSAIRDKQEAVLVEGQMDFLMTWQDGIKNVVATSGTALTGDQLKVLRRGADNLVMAFDNDSAGKAASERTIDLAEALDFNVRVLISDFADLKDPADIVKAKPGEMAELIQKAVPAMDYYFHYYGLGADFKNQPINEKKKRIRLGLAKIKIIASPIERAHWLTELSKKTGVAEAVLEAEMMQVKISGVDRQKEVEAPLVDSTGPANRLEVISQRILSLVLAEPRLADLIKNERELLPKSYAEIFDFVSGGEGKSPSFAKDSSDAEALADKSDGKPFQVALPVELDQLLAIIQLRVGLEPMVTEKIDQECAALISELKSESVKHRRRELREEIRLAEQEGNEAKLSGLLKDYNQIAKQ